MGKNGEIQRAKLPPGREIQVLVGRLQQAERMNARLKAGGDAAMRALEVIMAPVSSFLIQHCEFAEGEKLPTGTKLYEALSKALPPPAPPIGLG